MKVQFTIPKKELEVAKNLVALEYEDDKIAAKLDEAIAKQGRKPVVVTLDKLEKKDAKELLFSIAIITLLQMVEE